MTLLSGRYRLLDRLGQGGQAEVWRAEDTLLGGEVAVKRFLDDRDLRGAASSEQRALQLLRLPGVATLRDSGHSEGAPFLVMDLVAGSPFPGEAAPMTWARLAPRLRALLAVLAAVHAEGVIHRDLKPPNVLVDETGKVTVLDFGLATGRALSQGQARGSLTGSLPFLSPELLEGGAPSPRSDLFAVGAMCFRALSGQDAWPDPGRGAWAWSQAIRARPPRRLAEAGAQVPPEVEGWVSSLLAPAPANRPASAAIALERLDRLHGEPPLSALEAPLPPGDPLDEAHLRALFLGPSRVLHLPEDAAAALWQRTGGARSAVVRELHAWVLDGVAQQVGARFSVGREGLARLEAGRGRRLAAAGTSALPEDCEDEERDLLAWVALAWPDTGADALAALSGEAPEAVQAALDRLRARGLLQIDAEGRAEDRTAGAALAGWSATARGRAHAAVAATLPPGHAHRLRHLLASDDLAAAADEALTLAARLEQDGHLERAAGLLALVARWMHDEADEARERQALEALAVVALTMEQGGPLRLTQWAVARARQAAALQPVASLLEAALHVLNGAHLAARDCLPARISIDDERFELNRQALEARLAAEQSKERFADLLDGLAAGWGRRTAERAARVKGWQGLLAYRKGEFAEAARLALASAAEKTTAHSRLASLINAASALLEDGQWQAARAVAAEAEALACSRRLALYEARAVWVQRSALYRGGAVMQVDPELLEVAAQLHAPKESALIVLTEAAVAWRHGPAEEAAALASLAADRFRGVGNDAGALLCTALARSRGARAGTEAHPERLAEESLARCPPGVGLQVLALLADELPERARWLARTSEVIQRLRRDQLDLRKEVLSVSECLKALEQ